MPVDWNKHEPTLIRLAKSRNPKLSAQDIADFIGYPCTRGSVLGKAMRMGISMSKKPTYRKPKPVPRPRKKSFVPTVPKPLPEQNILDGGTLDITLMELDDTTCKWPSNSPPRGQPYTFCGHTPKPGDVYCQTHMNESRK